MKAKSKRRHSDDAQLVKKPYGNYVLIRRDEAPEQSKGGIIYAGTTRKGARRCGRGVVLDTGLGHFTNKGVFIHNDRELVGERVLFNEMNPVEVSNGGDVVLVRETDLLAVLNDE